MCRWATADLDCPDGGCFGIAFTLPDQFATFDSPPNPDPRPAAVCLQEAPPWNVSLDARKVFDGTCPVAEDTNPKDFCQTSSPTRSRLLGDQRRP